MYRVNIDTSDSEYCSSAGSSYTSEGQRKETPELKRLRCTVEKRKARIAEKAKEKKEKMEHNYPELIPPG